MASSKGSVLTKQEDNIVVNKQEGKINVKDLEK